MSQKLFAVLFLACLIVSSAAVLEWDDVEDGDLLPSDSVHFSPN